MADWDQAGARRSWSIIGPINSPADDEKSLGDSDRL